MVGIIPTKLMVFALNVEWKRQKVQQLEVVTGRPLYAKRVGLHLAMVLVNIYRRKLFVGKGLRRWGGAAAT